MGVSSILILALTIAWSSGSSNGHDIAKGSPVYGGELSAASSHGIGESEHERQLEQAQEPAQYDQDAWNSFIASRQLRSVANSDDDLQMKTLLPVALRNLALISSMSRERGSVGGRYPASAWSKRFYLGDYTNKRQNHSYRQCFFNPITCFRK